jgi:hypothetical protein
MDKERFLTLALLILVGLLPIAGIVCIGHAAKPKDRKATLRETYPDDHFFI